MEPKTVEFSRSFLFPWVKGRVSLENRMVKTRSVNTILGIIPAGKDEQTMPLSNISSVGVNTSYNFKAILIGVVAAVAGLALFGSSFLLGLILLLVGVAYIGGGIITVLTFTLGGNPYRIMAACYCKKAMAEICEFVNAALADTELGKDSREGAKLSAELTGEAFAKQMDRLVDAVKK